MRINLSKDEVREVRLSILAGWLKDRDTLNVSELKEPYRSFVASWCLQDYVFAKVVGFYLKRGRMPQPIGFLATVKKALRSALD